MSGDPINEKSLQILRETLGIGANGKRRGYRNQYVTKTGTPEQAICADLVEVGLMNEKAADGSLKSGEVAYTATETGRAAMAAFMPRNKQSMPAMPVLPKS